MTHTTTINVVGPGTIWHVGWQHLGMAILNESFRWAAFGFCGATTGPQHAERIGEAILFIEGTALDVTLHTFGLGYDADDLRHSFFTWVKHHKTPYHP